MENSNKKQYRTLGIVSGILLLLNAATIAINSLFPSFQRFLNNAYFLHLLSLAFYIILFIGSIVAAIGLFSSKKTVQSIGFLLMASSALVQLVQIIWGINIIYPLTMLAAWGMLSLANKQKSRSFACIALVVLAGRFAFQISQHIAFTFSFAIIVISYVLTAIYVLLACPADSAKKVAPVSANVSGTSPADAADKLLTLKGLLDRGVITQEEFDAKKKQLLGN